VRPYMETVPVEDCDGLKTQATPLPFLQHGDYVLLAGDVLDPDVDEPLLIAPEEEFPVLWRYVCIGWVDDDGTQHLSFDGGDETITVPAAPTAQVRRVLPGQEDQHGTWELPS
jgi:hypothetical protein